MLWRKLNEWIKTAATTILLPLLLRMLHRHDFLLPSHMMLLLTFLLAVFFSSFSILSIQREMREKKLKREKDFFICAVRFGRRNMKVETHVLLLKICKAVNKMNGRIVCLFPHLLLQCFLYLSLFVVVIYVWIYDAKYFSTHFHFSKRLYHLN